MLKEQGQHERAKAVFAHAMREGGFADNYALVDLLTVAHEFARPLTPTLLSGAAKPAGSAEGHVGLLPVGLHEIAVPTMSVDGGPFVVDMPLLDVAGSTELTMHFSAGCGSEQAGRIRIEAADAVSPTRFYDEEFSVAPSRYQAVVVPLAGRSKIKMRWTTLSEGIPTVASEINCIAPMLLEAA
jgi:hypothetical protein